MFWIQKVSKIHIFKKRVFFDQAFEFGSSVTQAIVEKELQFNA